MLFHKFFTRYMIEFNPWNWLLNVAFNVYIIWIDNWPLDQALDQSGHLEFDHLTPIAYTEMIFILNKLFEILILWTLCILLGNKIWNGVIGGQGWDKVTFRQRTTMHTKQWKKLVQGQPWFSLNLKIHIQLNVTQIEPPDAMKLHRRVWFLKTKSR